MLKKKYAGSKKGWRRKIKIKFCLSLEVKTKSRFKFCWKSYIDILMVKLFVKINFIRLILS